jgi:hypothetical protein
MADAAHEDLHCPTSDYNGNFTRTQAMHKFSIAMPDGGGGGDLMPEAPLIMLTSLSITGRNVSFFVTELRRFCVVLRADARPHFSCNHEREDRGSEARQVQFA